VFLIAQSSRTASRSSDVSYSTGDVVVIPYDRPRDNIPKNTRLATLLLIPASTTRAQVSFGINIGPPPQLASRVAAQPTPNHVWVDGYCESITTMVGIAVGSATLAATIAANSPGAG
jgi:hypothetical protein